MSETFRVCFLGDSVTLGTGDADCLGWPNRLCATAIRDGGHDVSCYNLGVRAETSSMIRARWVQESEVRLPEHVDGRLVFMFGLNDMAEEANGKIRVPVKKSLENAQATLHAASAWKPTLWIGPTPVRRDDPVINPGKAVTYRFDHQRTAELNDAYAALAREEGIAYFDVHAALAGTVEWDATLEAGDGVHPTAEGYAALAREIGKWPGWQKWLRS